MKTIQVRLPKRLIQEIEVEVKNGNYENKSDYIRNKLRFEQTIGKLIGLLPNKGDSVKEVREIRKKLSREVENIKTPEEIKKYLDELNKLIE